MRELYLLEVDDDDTAWQEHARCADVDPAEMIPGDEAAAARVCSWCAVKAECLAYAVANDERFGIRGGLTAQRRLLLTDTQPRD